MEEEGGTWNCGGGEGGGGKNIPVIGKKKSLFSDKQIIFLQLTTNDLVFERK